MQSIRNDLSKTEIDQFQSFPSASLPQISPGIFSSRVKNQTQPYSPLKQRQSSYQRCQPSKQDKLPSLSTGAAPRKEHRSNSCLSDASSYSGVSNATTEETSSSSLEREGKNVPLPIAHLLDQMCRLEPGAHEMESQKFQKMAAQMGRDEKQTCEEALIFYAEQEDLKKMKCLVQSFGVDIRSVQKLIEKAIRDLMMYQSFREKVMKTLPKNLPPQIMRQIRQIIEKVEENNNKCQRAYEKCRMIYLNEPTFHSEMPEYRDLESLGIPVEQVARDLEVQEACIRRLLGINQTLSQYMAYHAAPDFDTSYRFNFVSSSPRQTARENSFDF